MAATVLYWLFIYTIALTFVKIETLKKTDLKNSMMFLAKYGYISNPEAAMEQGMKDKNVVDGLMMYQKYAGIPVTGTLDNKTMGMMKAPRCGNTDKPVVEEMKSTGIRKKRFMVNSKWEKHLITYKIINYPDCCLSPEIVDKETDEAFEHWSNVIGQGLRIERRSKHETVDIDIKFTSGPHNDNMRFGSTGNGDRTVAHAFYPQQDMEHEIRGDIHFNIKEKWTSRISEGQNYLQTVMHEIGHSLGLDHSMEHAAVMYAIVPPFDPDFRLHEDDIKGVQYLYGEDDLDLAESRHEPEIQPRIHVAKQPEVARPRWSLPVDATVSSKSPEWTDHVLPEANHRPLPEINHDPFQKDDNRPIPKIDNPSYACNFRDHWSCSMNIASLLNNSWSCCSYRLSWFMAIQFR